MFGQLELVHHDPTGMSAYAIHSVASDGGFRLRCEGAVDTPLSDDLQLLAASFGSQRWLPGSHWTLLIDMMPRSDLPLVEEDFVAFGRQGLPRSGVADFEPGDIIGVAHARLRSVPLNVLPDDHRAPNSSSGLSEVSRSQPAQLRFSQL